MKRLLPAIVGTGIVVICLALPDARAGEDEKKFIGDWTGESFAGVYKLTWHIKHAGSKWQVSGTYHKDGKLAGNWKGKDAALTDGKLTFTVDYLKKPEPSYKDGAKHVVEVTGDKLVSHWTQGKRTGTTTLTRVGSSAAGFATHLASFEVEKGKVTEIAIVVVTAKASKGEFHKCNAATKFILKDGDTETVYDWQTVLTDPTAKASFRREMSIRLALTGKTVQSLWFSPPKKKAGMG